MVVSTIKASGGDFSTLSAWEAAKQADLTGAGPEEAECYNFALSDIVDISGWTTTPSDYIRVYVPSAERHNGTDRDVSGSGFQIDGGASVTSFTLRFDEDHGRFEGMDIKHSTASKTVFSCAAGAEANKDLRITDCIVHYESGTLDNTAGRATIYIEVGGVVLTMTNNIIYGNQRGIDTRFATSADIRYLDVYMHADARASLFSSEATVNNVYCGRASGTQQDFYTGGTPAGDYNASSDTTAQTVFGATNSLNSIAGSNQFTNVTDGSEDFHLKSGSALEAAGTQVSGVTTDIDGDTRDGSTPDIGADEFVAAAAASVDTGILVGGTQALSQAPPVMVGY